MRRLPLYALAIGLSGCASAAGARAPTAPPTPADSGPAAAAAQGAPSAPATGARQAASSYKPFAEVTRGAEHRTGLFDLYEKGDQLFLAVPEGRLGKDFLLSYQIAQGIGAAGVYGGTMLNIFEGSIVALERRGDRVFLVRRPTRFTASEGTPAARAVEISFGSSVLESAKIESVREDGALLINVHDWMVSDLSGVSERLRAALSQGQKNPPPVALEKGRSRLESVKVFPGNLNVRAKLTFKPAQPANLPSVPDGRYIPVTVAYVFAELPETPMEPRMADDRVGYFMTVRKDFSSDENSFFARQINRWRLEPGERVGDLVRPKKPIVFYLDPNIPEEYRPYMKAGVEAWSAAFEAAGWKDAIRAEMLPEDADAEDLRYATLRWSTSDQPGYGAIGPSIVDPRTGEILDADMLFEANMVRGFKRDWKTLVTPVAALEELFAEPTESGEWASLAGEISAQGSLLRALLAAGGEIGPNDPVPMEYVGEALKWVTMHEVGHTLGLRHNFRSSVDTPMEKLHDREWAERNGVFSSVMEYPSVNLPGKGPRGYAYNPGVGSYDRWAITFGYTPDAEHARQVAREAARPGHAYGTDEDARGAGALDPTVNVYDLGSDPLAWGKERADLVRGVWGDLPRHVLADNSRYADLTDAFQTLMVQYARALSPAVKYIGGQYHYRDRVGDPNGRAPFVPVPVAKQREALAFLTEYAFSERAFAAPPELLAQLGANRWTHWGEQNTHQGRIDYPFSEQVLAVQRSLLGQLTDPFVFARIRDAELKFGARNTLTAPELMAELTRAVWSEVYGPRRGISTLRRDVQRAHLDQLVRMVATPPARLPGDARAVARLQLTELDQRLAARVAAGSTDVSTRAHLLESRARIARALEAGLEVELRGQPGSGGSQGGF